MKKKLIGILVVTLMIATAFPAMGMSEDKESKVVNPDFLVHETNLVSEQMSPPIYPTFNRTWGTSRGDFANHGCMFEDYIYICGYCNYSSFHPEDVFLLKYDTSGSLIWSKTWDAGKAEGALCLAGYEGYIYVAGYIEITSDGDNMFLLKYSSDGNLIWDKTWGGSGDELPYSITVYDNNIYITGLTTSFGSMDEALFLLRYDIDGNLIWDKTWDGPGYDMGHGVIVYDNHIYVTGHFKDNTELMLLKYDLDGILIFEKSLMEYEGIWGNALIYDNNNIYITGGKGDWGACSFSCILVKCDLEGNTEWSKTWNGGNYVDCGYALDVDENYIYITGRRGITNTHRANVALLKYNSEGERLFHKEWGTSDTHEYGRSININDGFIYMSGGTGGPSSTKFDALLLKCDLEGEPGNNNPVKPNKPSGPKRGKVGEETTYSTSTTDLDGEKVKFLFDWGEGNTTWTGWVDAGTTASTSHVWTKGGDYQIRVKARDEKGGESEWSDPLPIKMPKNKPINTPLLNFLETHPRMFPLLRHLLKL